MTPVHRFSLIWLLASLLATAALAEPPRVLLVTAHPDDEALFAGAAYRITHELDGLVDLALLTNGEGGYKYSILAEPIYGLELTDEAIGRAYLPAIRKRELLAAGEILGLRKVFFFDQKDTEYTLELEPVQAAWDVDGVRRRLVGILNEESYDFVFVMLPTAATHAHHRLSAILVLEAAAQLPEASRPVVLGAASTTHETKNEVVFTGLDEVPITAIDRQAPIFELDRTRKLGRNDRLDYRIIVNWVIAAHKSQGTMQLLVNRDDLELYRFFALNAPAGLDRARQLFARLAAERPDGAASAPPAAAGG